MPPPHRVARHGVVVVGTVAVGGSCSSKPRLAAARNSRAATISRITALPAFPSGIPTSCRRHGRMPALGRDDPGSPG